MITAQIRQTMEWLQEKNYKSFYLAFLRVALSLWLLKEVCINWSSMDILYGPFAFSIPKNNFLTSIPGGASILIHNHYRIFVIIHISVILLNISGIGRWATALLLLAMVHILQQMNGLVFNNGNALVKLVLLYLIFADSYQYFVLFKSNREDNNKRKFRNLLSNLAVLSIMLQLCLAYFASGVSKIMDPYWQNGEATYYALSMERFMGTLLNKYIVQHRWIDYLSNYVVIAFELLFPFLIWVKKLRSPLLITGILFHLGIYIFLMIYGFQIAFILLYGLFLPNNKLLKILTFIKFDKPGANSNVSNKVD
ncbi:MAG: HTTM domain-containing protein [Ferruginibacter sp.]